MDFLKRRLVTAFTIGSFSLDIQERHIGTLDSTDLLVPLFLARKSLSVGCKRHHGGKVEWITVQPRISPLSAGSQGTVKSVAVA